MFNHLTRSVRQSNQIFSSNKQKNSVKKKNAIQIKDCTNRNTKAKPVSLARV